VGACTSLITVRAGSLTITEVARAGYTLTDIYTIPANRLISEDLNARSAAVTIVQGNTSTGSNNPLLAFVRSMWDGFVTQLEPPTSASLAH